MEQLHRRELLELESKYHDEALNLAAAFLRPRKKDEWETKIEKPLIPSPPFTRAEKWWKMVYNPDTNSYIFVRR